MKKSTSSISKEKAKRIGIFALGAVIGPPLFVMSFIILGAIQEGYSSISRPISALAIGPNGMLMQIAFVLDGVLVLTGTMAFIACLKNQLPLLKRVVCGILLGLSPLGMIVAGIFTMEKISLHMIGANLVCASPIISFFVTGLFLNHTNEWRTLSKWMFISCLLIIFFTIGFMNSVPFTQMATGGGYYGLWQRGIFLSVIAVYIMIGSKTYRYLKSHSI